LKKLAVAGGAVLLLLAAIFLYGTDSWNREGARIAAERKSEFTYLADCIEKKATQLKHRPTKSEYIELCLNPAPFLEEHQRVRSLDENDPSYRYPHYEYEVPPFKNMLLLSKHSLAPMDGFALLYWNGDSFDRYISWEKEKFIIFEENL
jgi:hypothetical protein